MSRPYADLGAAMADLGVASERWPQACRRLLDGLGGYPSGGDGGAMSRSPDSPVERMAERADPAWRDLERVVVAAGRVRVASAALSGRGAVRVRAEVGPLVARWTVLHAAGHAPGGWVTGALARSGADLGCVAETGAVRSVSADDPFAGLVRSVSGSARDLRSIVTGWTTTTTAEPEVREVEGWCPSHLRVGQREPSRAGHGRECRWCQDLARSLRTEGFALDDGWPPKELVRLHAEGRRVTERHVAEACRGLRRVVVRRAV